MTTKFKILLAVSAALFLVSLTDAGSAIAWGGLKPISFILFIVFFIGQLLHKEVVKYDEECRLNAKAPAPCAPESNRAVRADPRQRTPAMAH